MNTISKNAHILVLEIPILVVCIYDFGISLFLISKLALSVSLNKIVHIAIKFFYYRKKEYKIAYDVPHSGLLRNRHLHIFHNMFEHFNILSCL